MQNFLHGEYLYSSCMGCAYIDTDVLTWGVGWFSIQFMNRMYICCPYDVAMLVPYCEYRRDM
jgi:hypothetical protein